MFFDSMKNCFGSETDYSIEQDTAHRESRQVSEQLAGILHVDVGLRLKIAVTDQTRLRLKVS